MTNCFFPNRLKFFLSLCIVSFFVGVVFISESNAVTRFGSGPQTSPPAPIDVDGIWFFDAAMDKMIPTIDSDWVAIVFAPMDQGGAQPNMTVSNKEAVLQKAKELTQTYGELLDSFYDSNLLEDGAFFQLQPGLTSSALQHLIVTLNQHPFVAYTHPVLNMKENRYAFFNAFELEWKTGVSSEIKARILKQAHVVKDEVANIYRVDLGKIPLFEATNLLAEDIHIRKSTPYLVKLMPTIEATLSLPIHGGHLGDAFPFVFQVRFSDLVQIDPGTLATIDVRPTGIQKELFEVTTDPYDYVAVASKSPIRISGTLTFFASGEYTIPPIAVRYTCNACSNKQVRVIETQRVILKISSIVPSAQINNDLIVPMDNPPPDSTRIAYQRQAVRNFLFSIAAFAVAFVFIAAFIVRLKKEKSQAGRLQQYTQTDILKERLGGLLQQRSTASHLKYVVALNDTLRAYLAARYGFGGNPANGSGDVFFEAISHTIPAHLISNLKTIFFTMDRIISQEMNHSPDVEKLRESVLKVLEQDRRL